MCFAFSNEDPEIPLLEKLVGLQWWQYSQEWLKARCKFGNEKIERSVIPNL